MLHIKNGKGLTHRSSLIGGGFLSETAALPPPRTCCRLTTISLDAAAALFRLRIVARLIPIAIGNTTLWWREDACTDTDALHVVAEINDTKVRTEYESYF